MMNMNSLEEECLLYIMKNLNMYSAYYAKSEGTPYARQFEFLRRAYSEEIFCGMFGDFEEQHLDLLLSPYIKNLDIRHSSKELIPGIASRLKANENGIETVKARFSKLLYEELIPSLSHLVEIEIGGFGDIISPKSSFHGIYASEMIKMLGSHCPELKVLKLRDDESGYPAGQCFLSFDSELSPEMYDAVSYLLDRCPSLEILENINAVEVLYKKHILDLRKNDLEKNRKYSLTKLSFLDGKDYPVLDAFRICSSLCPDVTCVELHWIKGRRIVRCTDFMALQDVKILCGFVTIADTDRFFKMRGSTLVSLELYRPYISVQTLIQCCPELRHLTLSSVQKFKPVKKKDFSISGAGLPKLKSFFIDQAGFSQKISREAFKLIISAAKNLEKVGFHSMQGFSEEFCNSIFELGFHRVREVSVGRTDVPLSFLVKLLSEGSLQNLNVWHCTTVNSDHARETLLSCKRDNQTVKVTCLDDYDDSWHWIPHNGWDFSGLNPDSDIDSNLDHDSDDDLEAFLDSDLEAYFSDSDDDLEAYLNFVSLLNLLTS